MTPQKTESPERRPQRRWVDGMGQITGRNRAHLAKNRHEWVILGNLGHTFIAETKSFIFISSKHRCNEKFPLVITVASLFQEEKLHGI